jgi:protocatechuate 3,4-dioxygenase beta subunit
MSLRPLRFLGGGVLVAASLVAALLIRGGERSAMAAPPANDNFVGATNVVSLPFSNATDTAEATQELNEDQTCAGVGNTVWFSYTATVGGLLVADTAGSDFDTALAAYGYAFESPPLGLNQIACNNDGDGIGSGSEIVLQVQEGQEVFFQAGGAGGASGNLAFHLDFRPLNDDLVDAAFIFEIPFSVSVPTGGATDEAGETQPCGGIGKTVWYSLFAPGDFTVTISTEGSDYDTVLAAYVYGPTSPPLALQTLACNDDAGGGPTSEIQLQVQAGVEYLFQAGGKNSASGNLVFNLTGPPPGSISGAVTDSGGNPIAGAEVMVEADSCCANGFATTDASGFYRVEGLLPVEYRLFVSATGYVTEYYDNAYSFSAAQKVPVFPGAETTGINVALGTGGAIAGTVVVQGDGTPIAGASVYAQSDEWCCGYAETEATGAFSIAGLPPGVYTVFVFAEGYVPELYDDADEPDDATPITVVENMTTAGIAIDLVVEARITGTVTDAEGSPIEGATVFAYGDLCCASESAITESDGSYAIGALPPGQYRVEAMAEGYVPEYYDDTHQFFDATLVGTLSGSTTTGIDFALDEFASISGTVTGQNGEPVAGAVIEASNVNCCAFETAVAGPDGKYEITGLIPGSYRVFAWADAYVGEYYLDTANYNDATLVVTFAGTVTPGIDFSLGATGAISGFVTDGTGAPLAGIGMDASSEPCCLSTDFDITGPDGSYLLIGLRPGNYRVAAEVDGQLVFYDGVSSPDDATLVAVTAYTTTANIDFALEIPPTPAPSPTATYPPGVDTPTLTPTYTPIQPTNTATPITPPAGVYTHTPTPTPTATTLAPSQTHSPTASATTTAQVTVTPPPANTDTSTPTIIAGVTETPLPTNTDTSTPTPFASSTNTPTPSSTGGGVGRSEPRATNTLVPNTTSTVVSTVLPLTAVAAATAEPPATPRIGTLPIIAPDTGHGGQSHRRAFAFWLTLAAAGATCALSGVAVGWRR